MEQYGKTGQVTGDNIAWRMRFACWVLRLQSRTRLNVTFARALPPLSYLPHVLSISFLKKTGSVCERYVEELSCNHCCSGKGITISHSKCVFVALGIQHEMRVCNIVICGLSGSLKFFSRYLIKRSVFEKILKIKCVF
jgi:hypothetical protein